MSEVYFVIICSGSAVQVTQPKEWTLIELEVLNTQVQRLIKQKVQEMPQGKKLDHDYCDRKEANVPHDQQDLN